MAESLGLASRLLVLATFVFELSINLYNMVQSFYSYLKCVCDLPKELKIITGVHRALTMVISSIANVNLKTLGFLLF